MAPVGLIRRGWQGGEHDFCLAAVGNIFALEEACGAGIAQIYARLLSDAWRLNDVRETIRLGLIGGGMKADKALDVVKANVDANPNGLAPSVLLATAILQAALFGAPADDPVGKPEAAEAATGPASSTPTAASAARPSTDSAQV